MKNILTIILYFTRYKKLCLYSNIQYNVCDKFFNIKSYEIDHFST